MGRIITHKIIYRLTEDYKPRFSPTEYTLIGYYEKHENAINKKKELEAKKDPEDYRTSWVIEDIELLDVIEDVFDYE